jgi:hypothetical protein
MRYFLIIFILTLFSCKKLLQEKPSSDVAVPDSLEEIEALLNYKTVMNYTPGLNDLSADNITLTYGFWFDLTPIQHYSYIWAKDIYGGDTTKNDYNLCSEQILQANLVLEALGKIPLSTETLERWNNFKGQALFFRSCAFFHLSQLFAKPYDGSMAATEAGIPLRLAVTLPQSPRRGTVKETYARITSDLKAAVPLLKGFDASHTSRPSKPAAYGMLARVYQSMNMHDSAFLYADSCLQLYNRLLDYNTIDLASPKPFSQLNPEVIFETSVCDKADALMTTFAKECTVDTNLYQLYHTNDLRRDAFYSLPDAGTPYFKRSYVGSAFPFSGLATDEILLIRAEGNARANRISSAMNDLNTLLQKRWKQQTFTGFAASTASEALKIILEERRKELPLRGVRWTDLRRLNREGYGIVQQRLLNGEQFVLLPNDKKYVLPFPSNVIKLTGIEQNPR